MLPPGVLERAQVARGTHPRPHGNRRRAGMLAPPRLERRAIPDFGPAPVGRGAGREFRMAHEGTGAIYAAAGANLAIAAAKFVGGALTGSTAMLAEGVHSVVDTANQVLLLVGMK